VLCNLSAKINTGLQLAGHIKQMKHRKKKVGKRVETANNVWHEIHDTKAVREKGR
jgi:hypothetical protein